MDDVVPSALQRLRAADIIRMAGLAIASVGQEYCRSGAVLAPRRRGVQLLGRVDVSRWGHETGAAQVYTDTADESATAEPALTEPRSHDAAIDVASSTSWQARCTCSYSTTAMCRHVAALLYAWLERPESFQPDTAQSAPGDLPEAARPAPALAPAPRIMQPPRQPSQPGSSVTLRGPTPSNTLMDILTQMGLSELRGIAREYEIVTAGLNKQQLAQAIVETLQQPEVIRRVAGTLEKAQRQLLATLVLAGGSMTDDDLHGLFERFSFGPAELLQRILLVLQSKGLLFHTNLNSAPQQRIGLSGSMYDIGWSIPAEVRAALHVPVPITPFNILHDAPAAPVIQHQEPYSLLADLLLVGRALDGHQLTSADIGEGSSAPGTRAQGQFPPTRATARPVNDAAGSITPPASQATPAFVEKLQIAVPRAPAFLHYALRLLRLADILHRDDGGAAYLRLLGNSAGLLLGSDRMETARDLFELWLTQPAYNELYELQEEGLRLRCRTTPLNHPLLRPGELEAENREARQTLVALIAQAPLDQWISFPAFARFIYRLDPLYLQRRQRLFPSPHWWLEQDEGRPLQPAQLNDWMQAEGRYLARLIREPLHWWGICDLALSAEGHLLAFRLTPMAGLLFNATRAAQEGVAQDDSGAEAHIAALESGELLVACSAAAWPSIELIEEFAERAGIEGSRLRYRLTPGSLTEALRNGRQPVRLLLMLQRQARQHEQQADSPLRRLLLQLERWLGSYGHMRLYTGVSLLEVADGLVMRELSATTSIEEQVVRTITPTRMLLTNQGAERLIEELKRRGQPPLLHERPYYGTE